MSIRLHQIALRAFDVAALTSQWQQAAGFVPVSTNQRTALLAAPNGYIEVLPADRPAVYHSVNVPGISHVCVQAHAMPRLHGAWHQAGATFHAAPIQLATGNLYCYARDAEHNVIELEALAYAPPEQQPWLAHVAFASHDAPRLAGFYAALLASGSSVAPRVVHGPQLGPSDTYDALLALQDAVTQPTWVIGANLMLEFWQFASPLSATDRHPESTRYDHIAFEVDALDAAIDRALAAGATFGSRGKTWYDGAPSALLIDPDGNQFEFLVPAPPFRIADRPFPALVQQVEARKEHP
jgi:catechol 2,3-dioxygenase-like lactoylglutathione lyase family enzyme